MKLGTDIKTGLLLYPKYLKRPCLSNLSISSWDELINKFLGERSSSGRSVGVTLCGNETFKSCVRFKKNCLLLFDSRRGNNLFSIQIFNLTALSPNHYVGCPARRCIGGFAKEVIIDYTGSRDGDNSDGDRRCSYGCSLRGQQQLIQQRIEQKSLTGSDSIPRLHELIVVC